MPGTRAIERNSVPLSSTGQKTYTFTAQISSQCNGMNRNNLISDKVSRKSNIPSKNLSTTTVTSNPTMLSSRRSAPNEVSTPRGRSNTDVQSVPSSTNGLKQQQQQLNGSGSDKSVNHNQQQQRQSPPPPPKPECTLPSSGCQAECVTPSKLFNMMGYGLQNQYLFMHVHYLYLIDCRSREDFNQGHIITGNYNLFVPTENKCHSCT